MECPYYVFISPDRQRSRQISYTPFPSLPTSADCFSFHGCTSLSHRIIDCNKFFGWEEIRIDFPVMVSNHMKSILASLLGCAGLPSF